MSQRGSFVTEYIYCEECFRRVAAALTADRWKNLAATVIPGYPGMESDTLPIVAGKVGSTGWELEEITWNTFDKSNAPCHPVRIVALPEGGDPVLLIVNPDGTVDYFDLVGAAEEVMP